MGMKKQFIPKGAAQFTSHEGPEHRASSVVSPGGSSPLVPVPLSRQQLASCLSLHLLSVEVVPGQTRGLLRAVPVPRLIPQVWGWVRPSGAAKGTVGNDIKGYPHPGHCRPVSRSLCLWAGAAVGDPRAGCPRTLQPLWLGQGGGALCSPGVPLGPAGPMRVQGCIPHSGGPPGRAPLLLH